MLGPALQPYRKRRGRPRAPRVSPTPPPITGNVIVAVHHGGPGTEIVATVNGIVTAIDEPGFALQVRTGIGAWIAPTTANFDNLPTVVFQFDVGVSAATQWRVLDPTTWHFAGGEDLEEPYEGGIE